MNQAQQKLVRDLFDSSVPSSQLSWNNEFGAVSVLSAVITKKSNISNPLAAEKVGWFLFGFCLLWKNVCLATNPILTLLNRVPFPAKINDLRDVALACLRNSKTLVGVRNSGFALWFIVLHVPECKRRFSCAELVAAIINILDLHATTAETSASFFNSIAIIAEPDNPAGKQLFSNLKSVAVMINAAKKNITTSIGCECVGRAFGNITVNNAEAKRLFSTADNVAVIVGLLNKYATTPDSVGHLGSVIGNITGNNPAGLRFCTTSETVAAIVNVLDKYATTPESIQRIGGAVSNIATTSEGARLLATPTTATAIIRALKSFASTPQSVQPLASAINNIICCYPQGKRLFATSEAVSAIIPALNMYATTPESVECLGFVMTNITSDNSEGKRLFATPEAVSAIINALDKYATFSDIAASFGSTIVNIIVNNPEGKRLVSTVESVSVIINALSKHVGALQILTGFIINIVDNNPEGSRCATFIVDAFKSNATNHSFNVGYLAACICDACINPEVRCLLATRETAQAAVEALQKHGTTPEIVASLAGAIANIAINPEGRNALTTRQAAQSLFGTLRYATNASSLGNLASAIANISTNNVEFERMVSPEMASDIVNAVVKYATTANSVQEVGRAIGGITCRDTSHVWFSTPQVLQKFVSVLEFYKTNPDSVYDFFGTVVDLFLPRDTIPRTEKQNQSWREHRVFERVLPVVRNYLENSSEPPAVYYALKFTSKQSEEIDESTMVPVVKRAVERLLDKGSDPSSEWWIVHIFVVIVGSMDAAYLETVCRRDVLDILKRISADKYKDADLIKESANTIHQFLSSRFHRWLQGLVKKHSLEDCGIEISEDVAEALFDLEVDECNFLMNSEDVVGSLQQFNKNVRELLIRIVINEQEASKRSSSIDLSSHGSTNNTANTASILLHRLQQELPTATIFPVSDISFGLKTRGEGSYGTVVFATIISQQKLVAAKICAKPDDAINEAKNYLRLDHKNITKFFGVTVDVETAKVVLLLEPAYCDFAETINSSAAPPSDAPPLSVNNMKKISIQIAAALSYIHRNKWIHLDVKPNNVLVFKGKDFTVKLTDFGSMIEAGEGNLIEKKFVAGTKSYLPPEHQAARQNELPIPVSATFDTFAFGVMLSEMLAWDYEKRKQNFVQIGIARSESAPFVGSEKCCIGDGEWRDDVLENENGRKLIGICRRCLMLDPTKRIRDGTMLTQLLNDFAPDEEDERERASKREFWRKLDDSIRLKLQPVSVSVHSEEERTDRSYLHTG